MQPAITPQWWYPRRMTGTFKELTHAERSALALAGLDIPQVWRRLDTPDRRVHPAARRKGALASAIILSLLAVLGVLALQAFSVRDGAPGAVLFPSGTSEAQAFAAVVNAGGLPIRATRAVFSDGVVWIAAPADASFFSNVIDKGALVILNPLAFGGCFLAAPT